VINQIALILYFFLPVFNKPGWCINNPIFSNNDHNYLYCQDSKNNYPTFNLPKLSPLSTNLTYIGCLCILYLFTRAKDVFRSPSLSEDRTRKVQFVITIISILNYVQVTIGVLMGSQHRLLIYPWFASLCRPVLIVLLNSNVRNFGLRLI
jgi:hypothetical protein